MQVQPDIDVEDDHLDQQDQKNFHLQNLNHIEMIREKKRMALEEKQLVEQKQAKIREQLKNKVLNEAQRRKEEKRLQLEKAYNEQAFSNTHQVSNSNSQNHKIEGTSKISAKIRQAQQHAQLVQQQTKEQQQPQECTQEEQLPDQRNQMTNYFRSRYASFLNSLTEQKKEKQMKEEAELLKKERQLSKMRNELGLNSIQSKVLTEKGEKADKGTKESKPENHIRIKKKEEDQHENKDLQKHIEINKKLVEKQKLYLEELRNKKLNDKVLKDRDAQKKEKLRSDIKAQVLHQLQDATHIQTQDDIIQGYKKDKVFSDNLTGLDLQTDKKSNLKIVKENGNEDGDQDSDNQFDNVAQSPSRSKKLRSYPFITDLKQWKKKQRLDDSVRIFIIMGGYPDFKNALLQRGWVKNPDSKSPCYELKFTLMGKDIDYGSLNETQIVNHFEKANALTTKVGISRSLRNLIWFNNVDIDAFYPRCYDCNDESEFEDFLEDFKTTKAESILKLYMLLWKEQDQGLLDQMKTKVEVALKVCQRKIKDINDIIDDPRLLKLISLKEWDILSQDDLQAGELAKKKHDKWLSSIEQGAEQKIYLRRKKKGGQGKEKQNEEETPDSNEGDVLTQTVRKVLKEFKLKYPQYYLNGCENIWIIKPASLSRGRGIKCYKNLVEILDHMGTKESQWVIQKYIERPLVVKSRKMDIRQWVLVTDFNPVTVWFYEECYIRFTLEEYDVDNLDNDLQHLTNNSVQKKYLRKDDEIQGNMWYQSQFADWLKQQYDGQDVFHEIIQPLMKKIVVYSIEAVQDQIEGRKCSFEMFGYDFMIDERLNVWLIEVNSSPAMDYSTHITERLVKEVSNDLAKVIVDYGMTPKSSRQGVDTGKFTQLFKSKSIVEKPNTLGLNLMIEGKQIKR